MKDWLGHNTLGVCVCVFSSDRDRIVCRMQLLFERSLTRAIRICRKLMLMLHVGQAGFIRAWEVGRPGGKADTLLGGSSLACLCITHTHTHLSHQRTLLLLHKHSWGSFHPLIFFLFCLFHTPPPPFLQQDSCLCGHFYFQRHKLSQHWYTIQMSVRLRCKFKMYNRPGTGPPVH